MIGSASSAECEILKPPTVVDYVHIKTTLDRILNRNSAETGCSENTMRTLREHNQNTMRSQWELVFMI